MVSIPGVGFLTSFLNLISQSLQVPVIIFLIIFAIFAVLALGGLIAEFRKREKVSQGTVEKVVFGISKAGTADEINSVVSSAAIPESQKRVLKKIIASKSLDKEAREAYARNLIAEEQYNFDKILEKTDVVTRIGPTLGLMGTLIPMGPGLAALGTGDVTTLANAIIVAFDTTVVGIGAGAVAYFVSRIRRRWYNNYLSTLDHLIDALLYKFNS